MAVPRGTLKNPKLKKDARQLQVIPSLRAGRSPCHKCPLDKPYIQKVKPTLPKNPLVVAVGLHSGKKEQKVLAAFVGDGGALLRHEFNKYGLFAGEIRLPDGPNTGIVYDPHDPKIRVGFANLTRCRPQNDEGDFGTNTPEWQEAADRCWSYLMPDLIGSYPILLLGAQVLKRFTGDKGAAITRYRGLRHQLSNGRTFFVTWHPIGAKRHYEDFKSRRQLDEFSRDIKNVADYVLQRVKPPKIKVHVFHDPGDARKFLREFAKVKTPWAYDIETYDAKQFPSRKSVSVDPCHPDFRVRGIAFAWKTNEGAWIELRPWEDRKEDAAKLLGPVFSSPAEKYDFNGHFDEEALIYNSWIPRIRRRTCDGMLALLAINGGGLGGFSLARATVDILGEPQYWDVDKGRIEQIKTDTLAEAAVRDTISTFKLCRNKLIPKLRNEDYVMAHTGVSDDEDP